MDPSTESFLRDQLSNRRQRLEAAIGTSAQNEGLVRLLEEVDSALKRMDTGTYGLCDVCHDPVERDRLLADPLMCYCLDHLTPGQKRALEQDLELASYIQRELLPRQGLTFAGWEVAYHYKPLGAVSGDYCDVAARQDGTQNLYFALGDASGKGVAASMMMSHLHAIFRTLISTGVPLPELTERASRVLCESNLSTLFATFVCGKAGASGEIELCNAGHCPVLLLHRGEVTRLAATGVPLGMFCSVQYSSQKTHLEKGDTLFLYTDGLTEARSASDEEYGEERLMRLVKGSVSSDPSSLIRACTEDLATFLADDPLADDLTIMVIRRVG